MNRFLYSIYGRLLYCRYVFSFIRCVNKHWSIVHDVKEYTSRINYKKFAEYLKGADTDLFPPMYLIYWAFKYSMDIERDDFEYIYFSDYIESIEAGVRPTPGWMVNKFPTETHMSNLIPCSPAINERKNDLEYEIKLNDQYEWAGPNRNSDEWKIHGRCDIHDFLIENCDGEWNYSEFAGNTTVKFTEETDCLGFKLAWC